MSDFVFNVSKGRVAEFYNRVQVNDPTSSAIIIIPVDVGAVTDAAIRDCTTLAAVFALGVTERSTSGWSRKTLTDTDITALVPDMTNDRMPVDVPDQTWVTPTTINVTDLIFCYDNDTTTGTDANLIPMTQHDFAVTADGSNVVAVITDFYRAQ